MVALSGLLAQIRQRESSNNYGLPPEANYDYPRSHASGAYQFQPATWRNWTQASGIGTQYSQAYLAPPGVQDAVAAYAATHANPNSTALWGASAGNNPYPQVTSIDVTPSQLAANDNTGSEPGGGGSLDFSINPTSPNQLGGGSASSSGGAGAGVEYGGGSDTPGQTAPQPGSQPSDPFAYDPYYGGDPSKAPPGSAPAGEAFNQGVTGGLGQIGAWLSNWGVRFGLILLGIVLIAAAAWALAQGEAQKPQVIAAAAKVLK